MPQKKQTVRMYKVFFNADKTDLNEADRIMIKIEKENKKIIKTIYKGCDLIKNYPTICTQ